MSSAEPTPIDRLRVAVALIAIKHKPPAQSFPSYVLDLQAAFSDRGPAADTIFSSEPATVQANPHYTPGREREDDRLTWRAHALNLENEAAWLKGQLEAERVKNATLMAAAMAGHSPEELQNVPGAVTLSQSKHSRASAAMGSAPLVPGLPQPPLDPGSSNGNASGGSGGKKRTKKNAKQQHAQQPQAQQPHTPVQPTSGPSRIVALNQSRAMVCMKLLAMDDCGPPSESLSPLVAVDHLFQLADWISSSKSCDGMAGRETGFEDGKMKDLDLLAASVAVAIDAISLQLGSAMRSCFGGGWTAEAVKVFDVYAVVLQSIVTSVFPLFENFSNGQWSPAELKSSSNFDSAKPRHSEHLDRCLNALAKRILLPCIRSFVPLSIRHLHLVLQYSTKDARPHVLSLLKKLLSALFPASRPLQPSQVAVRALVDALKMSLVLDTLTELNKTLFPDSQFPDTSSDTREDAQTTDYGSVDTLTAIWNSSGLLTRAQPTPTLPGASVKPATSSHPRPSARPSARAKETLKAYEMHLAKKDGVWFLCAILHLLSATSNSTGASSFSSKPKSSSSPLSPSFPSSSAPTLSDRSPGVMRSAVGLNSTCERMRLVLVEGALALLSKCGKGCRGSTRDRNLDNRQDRNSLSNAADGPTSLGQGTTSTSVAGTGASVAQPHTSNTSGPEAASAVTTTGAKKMEGSRVESGRSGWGLDGAEYAMILGAAERVLLVYA